MMCKKIIRSVAAVLLIACAAAWGASYWRGVSVAHMGDNRVGLRVAGGRVTVDRLADRLGGAGWTWAVISGSQDWTALEAIARFHRLGFVYIDDPASVLMAVPLWCPTLLWAVVVGLVWRGTGKTRVAKPVAAITQ